MLTHLHQPDSNSMAFPNRIKNPQKILALCLPEKAHKKSQSTGILEGQMCWNTKGWKFVGNW